MQAFPLKSMFKNRFPNKGGTLALETIFRKSICLLILHEKKWQAVKWEGSVSLAKSWGSVRLQIFCAWLHRVLKRHPGGGFSTEGTSPFKRIRCLPDVGSGNGTADSKAFV
jgi:hypothetical protein